MNLFDWVVNNLIDKKLNMHVQNRRNLVVQLTPLYLLKRKTTPLSLAFFLPSYHVIKWFEVVTYPVWYQIDKNTFNLGCFIEKVEVSVAIIDFGLLYWKSWSFCSHIDLGQHRDGQVFGWRIFLPWLEDSKLDFGLLYWKSWSFCSHKDLGQHRDGQVFGWRIFLLRLKDFCDAPIWLIVWYM